MVIKLLLVVTILLYSLVTNYGAGEPIHAVATQVTDCSPFRSGSLQIQVVRVTLTSRASLWL